MSALAVVRLLGAAALGIGLAATPATIAAQGAIPITRGQQVRQGAGGPVVRFYRFIALAGDSLRVAVATGSPVEVRVYGTTGTVLRSANFGLSTEGGGSVPASPPVPMPVRLPRDGAYFIAVVRSDSAEGYTLETLARPIAGPEPTPASLGGFVFDVARDRPWSEIAFGGADANRREYTAAGFRFSGFGARPAFMAPPHADHGLAEVRAEVDFTFLSRGEHGRNEAGVLFGIVNHRYFMFVIDDHGRFALRYVPGYGADEVVLIPWTAHEGIAAGVGVRHRVAIEVRGNVVRLIVDDVAVGRHVLPMVPGPTVGPTARVAAGDALVFHRLAAAPLE